jgi:hypothetical protein
MIHVNEIEVKVNENGLGISTLTDYESIDNPTNPAVCSALFAEHGFK